MSYLFLQHLLAMSFLSLEMPLNTTSSPAWSQRFPLPLRRHIPLNPACYQLLTLPLRRHIPLCQRAKCLHSKFFTTPLEALTGITREAGILQEHTILALRDGKHAVLSIYL